MTKNTDFDFEARVGQTHRKALCLNMIVKNEMANLERCLGSIAGYIDCWVIADTGSTDGTQDFIQTYFRERNIPGELHAIPFNNFEQARNEALARACASPLRYDYLLFSDADMELIVEDPSFREKLDAPGYRLIQRAGFGLTYWNARLARRTLGARYRGVTHEYLDVPGGVHELQGVWYKDHATGSNRVDKFERDIRLLQEGLKQEPENARYYFYLAQSQRDAGRAAEAAATYAKRAAMGGWDEEAWCARLYGARCLLAAKDEAGFLREALAAFDQRPQRAEPLYDLARYYRERGMNHASALFCEAGLAIPRPSEDILFIEDFAYATGLLEEYSIVANYSKDPVRKERGHAACEYLTLSRDAPQGARDLARSNLRFYMKPAGEIMPSLTARKVGFTPPDGYHPMNPSLTRCGETLFLNQRAVNYTLTRGHYKTPDDGPIRTRNFLLRLNAGLDVENATEILPPRDMPAPLFPSVMGFEDLRVFEWKGELWSISNVRELAREGWCQQVLARLERNAGAACLLTDWRVISHGDWHEKNWMPQVEGDRLRFIYSCDPTRITDEHGALIGEKKSPVAGDAFRGGSNAVSFDGGWLALVHEVCHATHERIYTHRFVWFNATNALQKVSRRFYFHEKGIEFAAGMAWHPDGRRLAISFGVADSEAWIATVDASDIRRALEGPMQRGRGASANAPNPPAPRELGPSDAPATSGAAAETRRGNPDSAAAQYKEPAPARKLGGTVTETVLRGRQLFFFVTNPHDSIMRCHSSGRFYEEEELAIIERHYKGGLFVDIGANVGNHTIYVSKFLSPSRIILFEPNSAAIDILKTNLSLNGCANIFTQYLGIALGGREMRLKGSTPNINNLGNTMYSEAENGDVLCLPGDALLLNEPVEFIKLDVEGMETEILEGLSATVTRWRPTMFVEVWANRFPLFRDWCSRHSYAIVEKYRRYDEIDNFVIRHRSTP